jgi:methyl-accepting chemotaxis protein
MPVRLGFHTKLILVTIAIVLVTIVCLTLMQAVMTRQGYRDKGRAALEGVAATLHEAVSLQDSLNQQKIRADLAVVRLDELARELLNVIASMEGPDHSEQALDDVA